MFLNNDERWNNLREYYFENYDEKLVTFIFGLIINIICPYLFQIQNVVLGLFVTTGILNKENFLHILNTTSYQLVAIYDLTLFNRSRIRINRFWRMGKLALGYFFYILPTAAIGYLFLFIKTKSFVCQEMKAPFLLDNSYNPSVNMTELYQLRINYFYEKYTPGDTSYKMESSRVLRWDVFNEDGYRFQKYLPFETIDDLIYQFNYVGYHDVCIYPPTEDLSMSSNRTGNQKGLYQVYYGHFEKDQTGKYQIFIVYITFLAYLLILYSHEFI